MHLFLWLYSFGHLILADLFRKYIPSLTTSPISKAQIPVKATVFLAGLLQHSPDRSSPSPTYLCTGHRSFWNGAEHPSLLLAWVTECVQFPEVLQSPTQAPPSSPSTRPTLCPFISASWEHKTCTSIGPWRWLFPLPKILSPKIVAWLTPHPSLRSPFNYHHLDEASLASPRPALWHSVSNNCQKERMPILLFLFLLIFAFPTRMKALRAQDPVGLVDGSVFDA